MHTLRVKEHTILTPVAMALHELELLLEQRVVRMSYLKKLLRTVLRGCS